MGLRGGVSQGIPQRPTPPRHPRLQELLDDFERKVDEGTANLQSETDRAKHITKASATCWLYIVICLLLLVLVVLIAVRWV